MPFSGSGPRFGLSDPIRWPQVVGPLFIPKRCVPNGMNVWGRGSVCVPRLASEPPRRRAGIQACCDKNAFIPARTAYTSASFVVVVRSVSSHFCDTDTAFSDTAPTCDHDPNPKFPILTLTLNPTRPNRTSSSTARSAGRWTRRCRGRDAMQCPPTTPCPYPYTFPRATSGGGRREEESSRRHVAHFGQYSGNAMASGLRF